MSSEAEFEENMLMNEYNRALDLRNSNNSIKISIRGLFLGGFITLIISIFTLANIEPWLYLLIITGILAILMISIYFEYKYSKRVLRIENFSNYIQLILKHIRDNIPQKNEIISKYFVPLSFALEYIKSKKFDLKKCVGNFKKSNMELILTKTEKELIREHRMSEVVFSFISLIATILSIIFIIISIFSIF